MEYQELMSIDTSYTNRATAYIINQVRTRLRYNLRDFGEILNTTHTSVRNYEKCAPLSLDAIESLAKFLNTTPKKVVGIIYEVKDKIAIAAPSKQQIDDLLSTYKF